MNKKLYFTFHGICHNIEEARNHAPEIWNTEEFFLSFLRYTSNVKGAELTFDDGNKSDIEVAFPHLESLGVKAVFFVVAKFIDVPGYLSAHDIQTLAGHGHEIGLHGMYHRPWVGLNLEELKEEVLISRKVLENVVGREISFASCPFGKYNSQVLRFLKRCDFRSVFTSDRGLADERKWLKPRNTIQTYHTVDSMSDLWTKKNSVRYSTAFRNLKIFIKSRM